MKIKIYQKKKPTYKIKIIFWPLTRSFMFELFDTITDYRIKAFWNECDMSVRRGDNNKIIIIHSKCTTANERSITPNLPPVYTYSISIETNRMCKMTIFLKFWSYINIQMDYITLNRCINQLCNENISHLCRINKKNNSIQTIMWYTL